MSTSKLIVLVHGGAGNISDGKVPHKLAGMKTSVMAGYKKLLDGDTVTSAVEAAIMILEDDPFFNAGLGSVLNLDGEVELDAGIMRGDDLEAGGVASVKNLEHPICAARAVMENSPHVLLCGEGAMRFAKGQNLAFVEDGKLVTEDAVHSLRSYEKYGKFGSMFETDFKDTVGCIAMDSSGQIAVGSSTGGITGKYSGRVSDASQIGKGFYCDNKIGAVTITGHGETICKTLLAYKMIDKMKHGATPHSASLDALLAVQHQFNQFAGAVVLNNKGEIGVNFTTPRMSWAYLVDDEIHFGIDHGQHNVEIVETWEN